MSWHVKRAGQQRHNAGKPTKFKQTPSTGVMSFSRHKSRSLPTLAHLCLLLPHRYTLQPASNTAAPAVSHFPRKVQPQNGRRTSHSHCTLHIPTYKTTPKPGKKGSNAHHRGPIVTSKRTTTSLMARGRANEETSSRAGRSGDWLAWLHGVHRPRARGSLTLLARAFLHRARNCKSRLKAKEGGARA